MPLKIVDLLMRWILGLIALVFRGDRAKDAELDFCDSHRPHGALNQAAPLRALPDRSTDLDHFRVLSAITKLSSEGRAAIK